MQNIKTRYGILKGASSVTTYLDGQIKECLLNEYNEIETVYGKMVPQYQQGEGRRKFISSISFYEDGGIKGISLNEQMDIVIGHATYKAERIIFYEEGTVKRIFPLDGKITGFWTEENEYELVQNMDFKLPFGNFNCKPISLLFYKSEMIKSITMWPKERVKLETLSGVLEVRTGISMYENGLLKSCEPSGTLEINTPIGKIIAYDVNVIGICGDDNSLTFYKNGKIKSLITSNNMIEVKDGKIIKGKYEPGEESNLFNTEIMDIVPISIEFFENTVWINGDEYDTKSFTFNIKNFLRRAKGGCGDCASCNMYSQ